MTTCAGKKIAFNRGVAISMYASLLNTDRCIVPTSARHIEAPLDFGDVTLLVDGCATKDFGDTHSLVLLVDIPNTQLNQFVSNDPTRRQAA